MFRFLQLPKLQCSRLYTGLPSHPHNLSGHFFFLRTSDNITSYFKNLFSLHCPQDKVQSFYDSIKEPSKLNCRYYTLLSHHKIIFYAHYNPSSLRELCILISLAFSLAALYAWNSLLIFIVNIFPSLIVPIGTIQSSFL